MKQLFQDIVILLVWILVVLSLSWSLVRFTGTVRSTALVAACNAELNKQETKEIVKTTIYMTAQMVLFSGNKNNRRVLLFPIYTPYGLSFNLAFMNDKNNIGALYPASMNSRFINHRISNGMMDFYVNLWISNPLLKEQRSK